MNNSSWIRQTMVIYQNHMIWSYLFSNHQDRDQISELDQNGLIRQKGVSENPFSSPSKSKSMRKREKAGGGNMENTILLLDCPTLLLQCASLLLCIAGQQCRRLSRIFLTTNNSSLESSQQRRVIIHLLLLLLLLLLKANFLSKSPERAAPGRHVVVANGRLACTSAGRDAPANQNLGGRSRDAQPANQSSAPGQVTAAASIPSQQPFHSHFP